MIGVWSYRERLQSLRLKLALYFSRGCEFRACSSQVFFVMGRWTTGRASHDADGSLDGLARKSLVADLKGAGGFATFLRCFPRASPEEDAACPSSQREGKRLFFL